MCTFLWLGVSAANGAADKDAVGIVAGWLRPSTDGKMVIARPAETTGTLPRVRGVVLYDEPVGGIGGLSLSGSEIHEIKPKSSTGSGAVGNLSGPDEKGRILYIEDRSLSRTDQTSYRVRDLSGTNDEEVTSCAQYLMGSPRFLGMSHNSGKVAFVATGRSDVSIEPLKGLLSYFSEGEITVLDLDNHTSSGLGITALDAGIAWSPDGEWLAYVGRTPWSKLPDAWKPNAVVSPPDRRGKMTAHGFAVVRILNLRSKVDEPVGIGSLPLFSSDGQALYFEGPQWDLQVARAPDWTPGRARLPVRMTQPLLATKSGVLLGFGVPDKTRSIRYTNYNSPLVGKKEMVTLLVGRVNSNDSWTLIEAIDPRRDISGWIEDAEPIK